jgi:predicted dehydrogenase
MRYVVVGLGNIGCKRKAVLGARCVATVDPFNPAADHRDLADVPTDVYDAAVLSVPTQAKLDLLRYLLGIGKHVLVEKPLIIDEVQHLDDLARQHDCIWYTSYNHRFEPNIVRLKQLLDEGAVGALYHARLVYGNGTVQNWLGTWRESGHGVLEEVGCHLIDLTDFLFGYEGTRYLMWEASKIESQVFDHCIFATADRKIVLECATTMWKNTFAVDVYGQSGSLHLDGLCKWGPSELLIRQRVFPSGVPVEAREVVDQPDDTWQKDFDEFERWVRERQTSCISDLRISQSLHGLVAG